MDIPKDLKFKTEADRLSTMEAYSKEKNISYDEVNRIMNAPVEIAEPEPPEADVFADHDQEEMEPVPAEEQTAQPAPAPAPAPAQVQTVAPATEAEKSAFNRKWVIEEKDIPKDTYYDTKSGKARPYITHTDPQDLFKTVIHEQKRIHYLEDVLLPQERKAAEEQAKAAYQVELDKLKQENEQLKKAPDPSGKKVKAAQEPQPESEPDQPAAPVIGQSSKELQDAIDALKGIDSKDAIEHTDKIHSALMASLKHINNLTSHISKIQDETGTVKNQFQKIEQDRQTDTQRREVEQKQAEAQQNWQRACQLVDTFAQTNPDFKQEYGSVNQSFGEMTKEAVNFHTYLAGLMFNKHPTMITNEEQIAANQAYLKNDEKLMQAVQQYGINEPANYRAWVELDQVDAMRTGMYRDPITKQWVHMVDPVTKRPVHLGDMETSYGRYLDMSGKRQQKIQAMLKQQQTGLTSAITRRDKGVVSMDTNKLGTEGAGNDLTEQQASEILERVSPQRAQSEYMKTGNREMLDRLNLAMVRVGMPPLEIPVLRKRVA